VPSPGFAGSTFAAFHQFKKTARQAYAWWAVVISGLCFAAATRAHLARFAA
jgi:hypothetical protein